MLRYAPNFAPAPHNLLLPSDFVTPIEWLATPFLQLQPYIECYHGLMIPRQMAQKFMQWASPNGNVVMYFAFGGSKVYENRAQFST